jgi:hypothetical protein
LDAVNPVINVPNQLIWSTQGNNFTMECNVEAFPRSVNYWIRGDGMFTEYCYHFLLSNLTVNLFFFSFFFINVGELIISGSKFGVSEVRDSIFASRMALTVHSFEKSDIGRIFLPARLLIKFQYMPIRLFFFLCTGKYRCIAKNSLGEVEGRIHVYESNSWPAVRATTKRSIDYADDLEESNNGVDHNHHHRQQHQQRRQQQGNEVDERGDSEDEEEEHNQQQGDGLSAAPAGRDTLHYQLTTTERSSWRSGNRNGSPAGSLHSLPLFSSTSFICFLSLILSFPQFIPFCRYI